MAEQTIMLNCAAGMSTSLLVTKMQEAAKKQGIDAKIFACPASEAPQHLDQETIDCLLLGPQVRYMEDDMKGKVKGKGKDGKDVPVAVIDMQAYGMMNGEKVLKQAEDLING
ncbi:PTS sugar transporter subunit IIB [Lactobacillus sp. ESL0679]|uniref:PTS sugar transporter subunit IIB n=1 Tax=unclassified Lactobacillus TaxID=2620435 RepID=UPI0023F99705|nr:MULTISPECIES: PTS sugar transporter subunit IIB [unclassified Lactobacillus]MDF7683285.1 PTS sugar transporter subunit IIB [Lactobacillus sp. ESL0679]WEV37422.1 PTS sugar transporter subunit IIB [Lactobacillus sp. ESL0677]WEV51550.1 PTS sugar transporter subunit IIB [Lactobacillus sp. ESL0700]WEV62678.1 PTS sugar transporter subunit IIB [Lactobacillus sp. ESL0731]